MMKTLEGKMLGRYQLSERIGRGGMADVYRGYQPNLERAVAVKVLHPHLLEDPSFAERFRREAKSVAALHHPNIIQVIDFDTQGDYLFMVMEFVEGGHTLKKRLRELADLGQRIPLPQTLGLVAQIADALDYAHRQGMIHRDVKPANILLPTLERPLLSDFGIARIVGARGLTADGMTIGTPTYMSPEQSRAEPATERRDIYALGVVLFEMITGQPPYEGTPYDILKAHQHEPTPSPRRLAPMLPDEVEQIVLTCLAKDPAERYQRAGDLRDALRKASDGLRRAYEALDQRTAQDEPTEGLHALAAAPVAAPRDGGRRYGRHGSGRGAAAHHHPPDESETPSESVGMGRAGRAGAAGLHRGDPADRAVQFHQRGCPRQLAGRAGRTGRRARGISPGRRSVRAGV